MTAVAARKTTVWFGIGLALVAVFALVSAHAWLLTQSDETISPLMPVDRLFDLVLVFLLSVACIGVGRWFLRLLNYRDSAPIAHTVLAWSLGAGTSSHLLLLLGVLKILSVPLLLALLGLALILTAGETKSAFQDLRIQWQQRAPFTRFEQLMLLALIALVVPVLLSALTPPTDGDALSYQLAAPALFLNSGAVIPIPTNTGANYPLGSGMLFMFGLAAGSPIAAQLTHFAFGLALMVALYSFTSENFGRSAGLLASAIYWTSAVIGLEASAPLLDLGWVLFEFLAIWMFWRWHQSRSTRALIVVGITLGFALSSKYLAFVGLGTLLLFVLVDALLIWRVPLTKALTTALIVGGVAFVVNGPWLVKNLFLLGNPIYPFLFGSYGLDGKLSKTAGGGLSDWVGIGMGTGLDALLAFPYNVYVHWQRFDPVKNRGGPSLFFWFLPFYLLVPKRALINMLLLMVVIRFAVWWNLTQFVRYGLILFPLLSLISAYIVWELWLRARGRWSRPLLQTVIAFCLAVALALQWGFLFFLREDSLAFLLGQASRATYLNTNLQDYAAIRFVNTQLSPSARLFALGDTRVFYLERPVVGDVSHTNWSDVVALGGDPSGVAAWLRAQGITHLWVSEDEISYARNFWNIPAPWENAVVPFNAFRTRYLESVYADDRGHSIYALKP